MCGAGDDEQWRPRGVGVGRDQDVADVEVSSQASLGRCDDAGDAGDRAVAEDLIQEAFVRFVGRFLFLGDPDAFEPFCDARS